MIHDILLRVTSGVETQEVHAKLIEHPEAGDLNQLRFEYQCPLTDRTVSVTLLQQTGPITDGTETNT